MGRHAEKISARIATGFDDLSNFSQNFLIAGVRLDNYSGSWLTVTMNGTRQFVPPYTIGWMSPAFPLLQTGPNVVYSDGPNPNLYPSTTDGTPAQLAIYEDSVPPAPGYSYLNPFGTVPTDNLTAYASNVLTVSTSPVLIPTAYPLGRRAVLLQSSLNNTGIIFIGDSAVTADDGPKGGIQLAAGGSYPMDVSALADIYAISDTVSQKLIVAEGQ